MIKVKMQFNFLIVFAFYRAGNSFINTSKIILLLSCFGNNHNLSSLNFCTQPSYVKSTQLTHKPGT